MKKASRSIYLDNAATTYPKPEVVYQAIERFMRDIGGSAGRSGHWRAVETGRMVYEARQSVAELFGVPDPLRVIFTKNATEALNIAIQGLLKPGDHVVTSSMEHNSVMRPLEAAAASGVTYSVVECARDGKLDPADLAAAIRPGTSLVALNHASNVTGTILPVEEAAAITKKAGVLLLVDAAQTAGRLPIDSAGTGIDLLAFTGHKELFGPQGTGGLYIRDGLDVAPLCYGGTGSKSSRLQQPEELPDRYESGTLNAAGIIGLGAGVKFVSSAGIDAIREHEVRLLERLAEGIAGLSGITIHGPADQRDRIGVVSLTLETLSPPEAAERLDTQYGIATRAGLHCAPLAHRTIGTLDSGTLRLSFSYMNTEDEVDYLLECLGELAG
jgi:cysteine desulfurase/selenocysteine lyase